MSQITLDAQEAPSTRAIERVYDQLSTTYEASQFHVDLARDFIRWSKPRRGQAVLDFCTGTGLVALEAKRVVGPALGRVIGADVSDCMLEVGRRNALQEGLEIEFVQRDCSSLEWLVEDNATFDLITCCSGLVYMPAVSLEHIISRWTQFLKPGGKLIADVPCAGSQLPFIALNEALGEADLEQMAVDCSWITSLGSIRRLWEQAGLGCVECFETRSYERRTYELANAAEAFNGMIGNVIFGDTSTADPAKIEVARRSFIRRLRELAGPDGKIVDEIKVYVAIGTKM